MWEID